MLNTIKTEEGIPDREEIEQVRRLLFGEMQEANKRRMDALEDSLNRTRALLEAQIAALRATTSSSQADLIKAIGGAIGSLGQQIVGLANGETLQAAAPEFSSPIATALATTTAIPASAIEFEDTEFDATNASSAAAGAQDHE